MSNVEDLSVVIPSWNGRDALRAHLPSVLAEVRRAGAREVVVADDGSDDDSAGMLASDFPGVRVVARETRGGFARAANTAIAAARGRLVALLNNDMDVRSGTLPLLASALESPAVFASVPCIVRVTTGAEEARTRLRFRRGVVSTSIDGAPGSDPAYACGGAMAFRREELVALGGFDPLFSPFYWEDVDLSYRARKRGRRIVQVENARVDHDHGRTIGACFAPREVATVYERNRLLFTWKNLTDPGLWRAHLAALPAKTLWDLVAHPAFVRGLGRAWALRGALAGARRAERLEETVPDRELLSP